MLSGTPYLLEGADAEEVVHAIERVQRQVATLRREGALDDKTVTALSKEWRVEQVYETTGIEGNSLSLNETKLVLQRGITVTGKPSKDSHEAQRMSEALDYLETLATDSTDVTARDIRELQHLILGREHEGAGVFRSADVRISGSEHQPLAAAAVPRAVDELVHWLNHSPECPVPLRAAVVHAWLAHIHPFADGNGRTARALMNLVLVRGGFPVALIRRKDRNRYYDALAASDDGDIGPLVDLIVKRIEDSLRQILRVRAETTGLTEAVRQAAERLEAQYAVWHQAMLLLLRSIEEAAEIARDKSDGAISVTLRQYDEVTLDDYRALLRSDSSGNGWLAVLRGHGVTKGSELLLWNGYRSRDMGRLGEAGHKGGSIFFSRVDPKRRKGRYAPLEESSTFPYREIAFDGGNYLCLRRVERELIVERWKANALARSLVTEFVKHFLT